MCVRCVCVRVLAGQTGVRTLYQRIHTDWASWLAALFKLCGQASTHWLVPLVLFESTRAGKNIDVSEMNYLSLWTADVSFKDSKKYLDRISKCRTNSSSCDEKRGSAHRGISNGSGLAGGICLDAQINVSWACERNSSLEPSWRKGQWDIRPFSFLISSFHRSSWAHLIVMIIL